MPAHISGIKSEPIPQVEESGAIDRYGVSAITRVEQVPVSLFSRLIRAVGSIHPRFPSMAVARVTWDLNHAGTFYKVNYIYEGFISKLPDPTYELSGTLSEEPIQTHKNFAALAGTPDAPRNDAIFLDPETQKLTKDNEKGVFQEFGGGSANRKAGVASFVSPGVMWTAIYFSVTRPAALRNLGTIDAPDGPNPSISGRNWLMWDMSYRQRGFIYEIRITWKLSGRNGWDPDIYD
jgi:hypothetical protein